MMDHTEVSVTSSPTPTSTSEHKRQPWRSVWPAPRESQPQAQIYGFNKGETMVFDGNAGNFFARDGWSIEQQSDNSGSLEKKAR
jgi:hypothetical protein